MTFFCSLCALIIVISSLEVTPEVQRETEAHNVVFDLLEPTNLLFVFVVALVLFGPRRLIDMSRELGQYIRRIREHKEELKDELTSPSPAKSEPEEKQPSTTAGTTEKK